MRVKNLFHSEMNDLEINADAIGLRSIQGDFIALPYYGSLPEGIASAAIVFNVSLLVKQPNVRMVCDNLDGTKDTHIVQASNDEVASVLDRFFAGETADTGLNDYWLGLWQGSYTSWRVVAMQPIRIAEMIAYLPDDDCDKIMMYISKYRDDPYFRKNSV